MPRLYKSEDYNKQDTIALIKKLDDDSVRDDFLNIGTDKLETPPQSDDEVQIKLKSDFYYSPLPKGLQEGRTFITYCAGMKRLGKTHEMCRWIHNYQALTNNPVFLVSSKTEDPTIEEQIGEKSITRIPTDSFAPPAEDEEDERPKMEDFQNCLICFDDFINDENSAEILKFLNRLAERGAQEGVCLFTIWHNITNSWKTKMILGESDYFIVWPKSLSNHNWRYFGQQYANIDDKRVLKKLKKESGGCITISRVPQYIVSAQNAFLPNFLFEQ
jgi:hypothetical protein